MTGFARGKRTLIVAGVAGEAAQAFVNAHRSAIVARSHLRTPMIRGSSGACLRLPRGVALVAQTLTCVGTDFHGPGAVRELRKRKRGGGEVHLFAPIEDGKRRSGSRGRQPRCARTASIVARFRDEPGGRPGMAWLAAGRIPHALCATGRWCSAVEPDRVSSRQSACRDSGSNRPSSDAFRCAIGSAKIRLYVAL